MKKGYIILIAVAAVFLIILAFVFSPLPMFFGGAFLGSTSAEIEIDSYRLCQDNYGEHVIIIKYLLKNTGEEPTSLFYEGDFYVYQNGVELTEYYDEELPKEWHYDSEDQFKNVKGGVEYYAEIAYSLESLDEDVEVEVNDYGFFDSKKEKVFQLR